MADNLSAAQSNDRRVALVALRDTLAAALDDSGGKGTAAQLAAQYRATLLELESLGPAVPVGGVDELKKRRAAKGRGAAADASGRASRSV